MFWLQHHGKFHRLGKARMVKKFQTLAHPRSLCSLPRSGAGRWCGLAPGLRLSWWRKSQFLPEPPSPAYSCQRVNGQTNSTAARNCAGLLYR